MRSLGFSAGMGCFSSKHTSAHAHAHTQALHLEAPPGVWSISSPVTSKYRSKKAGNDTKARKASLGGNPPSSLNVKREALVGARALDHSPGETLTF